jgi:hypothetical protein
MKSCIRGNTNSHSHFGNFHSFLDRPINYETHKELDDQFPSTHFIWKDRLTKSEPRFDLLNIHYNSDTTNNTKRRLVRLRQTHLPPNKFLSLKHTNVIYAIYDTRHRNRLYVGQTIFSAYERFKQHVNSGRQVYQKAGEYGAKTQHAPFHATIARIGWKHLRIFVLEQIGDGSLGTSAKDKATFETLATPREIFWKRTLHAFAPNGLVIEHKRSRANKNKPPTVPKNTHGRELTIARNTNAFIPSKWHKKIISFLEACEADTFFPAHLEIYSAANKLKMFRILQHSTSFWNVDLDHINTLSEAIFSKLCDATKHTIEQEKEKLHVVLLYLHKSIRMMGIHEIMCDNDLWQEELTETTRKCIAIPALSYKYSSPISLTYNNAASTATLSQKQTNLILSTPCLCHRYKQFCPEGSDHVLTTDMSLMGSPYLEEEMLKGAKHKTTVHENALLSPPGSVANNAITQDLRRALTKWSKTCGYYFGSAIMVDLESWTSKIISLVKTRAPTLFFPEVDPNHGMQLHDLNQLKEVQQSFVISSVDKAASNFFIQCRKEYITTVFKELNSGGTYTKSDMTSDELVEGGNLACRRLRIRAQAKAKVPTLIMMAKLHSSPVKFRFVAGSSKAPLRPISKVISTVLKTFLPYLKKIWDSVALQNPMISASQLRGRTGWIVESSTDVMTFFELNQFPREFRSKARHLWSSDFATMYTSLPLDDLILKVGDLMTRVFELNKVSPDVDETALCFPRAGGHIWISVHSNQIPTHFMMFTLRECLQMLSVLVNNTYAQFGGHIWYQRIGLPMGTNCAGFLSNVYLFFYELEFLRKAIEIGVTTGDWTLATKVATKCVRYIDDLLTLDFKELTQYLNVLDGIYPPNMDLKETGSGKQVDYMDLDINQNARLGFIISIFDKRLDSKFEHIKIIRYPHATSILDSNSLYGIVTSQMYRASKLCTRPIDFAYQSALVIHRMLTKHYVERKAWAKVRAFLSKKRLYLGKSNPALLTLIRIELRRLQAGESKPGPRGKMIQHLPLQL